MVKLEVGKYYKRRDGRKVGPMVRNIDGTYKETHPFACPHGYTYKANGGYLVGDLEGTLDIIAEWTDKPASPVRTVTSKEIVPGQYGFVKVHDPGTKYVRINLDAAMECHDIRAAIATLTKIADAMEEQ